MSRARPSTPRDASGRSMSERPYRQTERAASVAATQTAILDAVDAIFLPDPGTAFTLDQVAKQSGATVQTILRHFGSKSKLIEASAQRGFASTRAGRDDVPVADLPAIAHYLAEHYESVGPMVLRMLGAEADGDAIAEMNESGRDMHRAWVERVFGPMLGGGTSAARRRRLATLIAVTDLLTWKLLRLEQGLSARDYERCVRDLLERLR